MLLLQDPGNLDEYLSSNIFLPDINNEHEDKKAQYADNLASLQRLVLYRFEDDTTGEHQGAQALTLLFITSMCHCAQNA